MSNDESSSIFPVFHFSNIILYKYNLPDFLLLKYWFLIISFINFRSRYASNGVSKWWSYIRHQKMVEDKYDICERKEQPAPSKVQIGTRTIRPSRQFGIRAIKTSCLYWENNNHLLDSSSPLISKNQLYAPFYTPPFSCDWPHAHFSWNWPLRDVQVRQQSRKVIDGSLNRSVKTSVWHFLWE